jgi:iron complex outermembrane receptor protein
MRMTLAVAVACLALGGIATAADATAAMRQTTDIPAEGLGPALTTLAKVFDFQVLYRTEVVGKLRTEGASGALTAPEALERVLTGTGLTYKYLDDKTVTIIPVSTEGSGRSNSANASGSPDDASKSKEAGKKTSQDFRVAQMDQGKSSGPSSVGQQNSTAENSESPSVGLQEILVTAQKRTERLLDVPVPVTAIDAQALVASNQLRIQDYVAEFPGLTMTTAAFGYQSLSIRGISPLIGGSAPTVSILVDDVPFGGNVTGRIQDIDPGDLVSVEVLRGPQGTLYGSSSMGGLVKYVTAEPSTEGFSGHVQAGLSSVYNGNELGYNFRASANVPVSNDIAIRIGGFTRIEPGYIDNVLTGQNGINEQRVSGGHLSALFRLSDQWSLKLSGFYQKATALGVNDSDVLPGLGELEQSRALGSGYNEQLDQGYSAKLDGRIGNVDFKSITGYSRAKNFVTVDYSSALGFLAQELDNVAGAIVPGVGRSTNVSQEFRLSSSLWNRLDWLAGAFYTHEDSGSTDSVITENPITGVRGVPVGDLLDEDSPSRYSEYAAFLDLTYHFTDQFDVQIGGRETKQSLGEKGSHVGPIADVVVPVNVATSNSFTYLLTPQFRFSPNLMMYARLASGFRVGGFNVSTIGAALGVPIPPTFAPDKTYNYDLGLKGEFLDHKLSIDASLYYIDWKDIQLSVFQIINGAGYGYVTNAGGAKSEGVELSFSARPLTGLTITGWVDYDNAVLTSAFPLDASSVGAAGDRLPFSLRFSGNLSVQQDFGLWGSTTGYVGAAVNYQGDRLGKFTNTTERQFYPSYAKTDLQAGVKDGPWTFSMYVNNAADKRGLIVGGLDYFPPAYAAVYIRPRLIGMNISRTF